MSGGGLGPETDALHASDPRGRRARGSRDPKAVALAADLHCGPPRSGTTFLHGLLAEDPANRAPRTWEAIYPYPKHRAAKFGAGRRMVATAARYLHPALARDQEPASDRGRRPGGTHRIYEPVFRSPRFDDVYRAPSHRAWLDASGYEEGDRFLARFLRHLQGRGDAPRRWILKSPKHRFRSTR